MDGTNDYVTTWDYSIPGEGTSENVVNPFNQTNWSFGCFAKSMNGTRFGNGDSFFGVRLFIGGAPQCEFGFINASGGSTLRLIWASEKHTDIVALTS